MLIGGTFASNSAFSAEVEAAHNRKLKVREKLVVKVIRCLALSIIILVSVHFRQHYSCIFILMAKKSVHFVQGLNKQKFEQIPKLLTFFVV